MNIHPLSIRPFTWFEVDISMRIPRTCLHMYDGWCVIFCSAMPKLVRIERLFELTKFRNFLTQRQVELEIGYDCVNIEALLLNSVLPHSLSSYFGEGKEKFLTRVPVGYYHCGEYGLVYIALDGSVYSLLTGAKYLMFASELTNIKSVTYSQLLARKALRQQHYSLLEGFTKLDNLIIAIQKGIKHNDNLKYYKPFEYEPSPKE